MLSSCEALPADHDRPQIGGIVLPSNDLLSRHHRVVVSMLKIHRWNEGLVVHTLLYLLMCIDRKREKNTRQKSLNKK